MLKPALVMSSVRYLYFGLVVLCLWDKPYVYAYCVNIDYLRGGCNVGGGLLWSWCSVV